MNISLIGFDCQIENTTQSIDIVGPGNIQHLANPQSTHILIREIQYFLPLSHKQMCSPMNAVSQLF